jgi:hypothetical protein
MQQRSGQHAVGLGLRNAETRVHVADEALNGEGAVGLRWKAAVVEVGQVVACSPRFTMPMRLPGSASGTTTKQRDGLSGISRGDGV